MAKCSNLFDRPNQRGEVDQNDETTKLNVHHLADLNKGSLKRRFKLEFVNKKYFLQPTPDIESENVRKG